MSNQTPKKRRTMRDFFASPSGDATLLMASARFSDSRESLSDKSESPSTEMMSANKAIDLVTAQPVAQEAKKRKYSEDFIRFGFIVSEKIIRFQFVLSVPARFRMLQWCQTSWNDIC